MGAGSNVCHVVTGLCAFCTRSSPQTQGGVWKLMTGRKVAISSQRINNSSSVTSSPVREPPVGRERIEKKERLVG